MLKTIIKTVLMSFALTCSIVNIATASCGDTECSDCCAQKGGIRYGDSSSGRYVCNDGDYSVCYSTIHAIMDMQKFEGCCMWHGGVLKTTVEGLVICRNGSYSEICSLRNLSK